VDERMIMRRPMVAFFTQLLLAIRSRFSRRARLEAENLLSLFRLLALVEKPCLRLPEGENCGRVNSRQYTSRF
jgi:hypothetical protein